MEFLRFVEDELRGLAAEARRRHPVVQEAAERAILKLRNMREEYAVALRRQHEGNAPPLTMFRSQDLLRPFLLACNHSDASPHLIITAIRSMQYLINCDAILPSDAPNILRVLAIQSQSKDTDVQKGVLQTMVMVVTWKSCEMTQDTIAQALGVCLGLHTAKNFTVRTAADMTVRQIISLLFDRVAEELSVDGPRLPRGDAAGQGDDDASLARAAQPREQQAQAGSSAGVAQDGGVSVEGADGNHAGTSSGGDVAGTVAEGSLRCARLVFQDLCVLSRGEGQCIKRTSVSTTLGLELVEQVLSQQPLLFRRYDELRGLLCSEVCPLILRTLRRRMNFPLLVRLVRTASTFCVSYGDLLPKQATLPGKCSQELLDSFSKFQTEVIISSMLTSLGTGHGIVVDEEQEGDGVIDFAAPTEEIGTPAAAPSATNATWAALLTLEAVHRVLSVPWLALELFRHGGAQPGAATVVEESVQAVSTYLLRFLGSAQSIQSLDSMAHSIRVGRSSPSSPNETRRLPLPASLVHALSRDVESGASDGARQAWGALVRTGAEGMANRPGTSRPTSGSAAVGGGGGTRSSSSELLHETDEPSLDDAEPLLWALHCAVDLALGLAALVEEEFGTADRTVLVSSAVAVAPQAELPEGSVKRDLREMCKAVWSPVLTALSHVLSKCSDPLLVAMCADAYQSFAFAGAVLGLESLVDGFIGSLCRFSLPQWHGTDIVAGGGGSGAGSGGTGGGGSSQGAGSSIALNWNHVGMLQSVLIVTHRLGNILRGSWHVVLDTLEQAAALLTRRAIARPRWSPSSQSQTELAEVERHCMGVLQAAERLVGFSACLEDDALYTLMSSLQALAVVDLANSATLLPQERTANREMAQAQPQSGGSGGSGGPGAVAVAAASGLVSMVGAAARAAISGPGGEARDAKDPRAPPAKVSRPVDARTHSRSPWASSRLVRGSSLTIPPSTDTPPLRVNSSAAVARKVVECAVVNTWRLSVVWELVSGHLRVVAKAREPGTREYAVRALSELIVDSVQRLHPLPLSAKRRSTGEGASPSGPSLPAVPDPASAKGPGGGNARLDPILMLPRAKSEESQGPDVEDYFRWVFDSDVSGVFVTVGRAASATELGADPRHLAFEGVLFETMRLFALTPHIDTREATLQTLYTILQSCGQVLTSAWPVILNLLHSVAKAATDAPPVPAGTPLQSQPRSATASRDISKDDDGGGDDDDDDDGGGGGGGGDGEIEREDAEADLDPAEEQAVGRSAWGGGCLPLAFKCLQLIVDDFLERIPREEVVMLVTCTGAFGRQTENVNLSLTAIGMLWSVCDTFADATVHTVDDELDPAARASAPAGASNAFADVNAGGRRKVDRPSTGSSRGPRKATAATDVPDGAGGEDRLLLHTMWPAMLFELRSLAVDFRPELRNCAVNTMFSTAVGNGAGLTEQEWKQFLLDVTFPLIAQILESTNSASRGANTAVAPELKKGVRMMMHHTRDTDRKQWNETRVLAMQGLGRVLRAYVGDLAGRSWFSGEGGVWEQSLQVFRDACLLGSDSQEVALAGIDGITTMVLLVGKMGLKSVQVRAGTGMKIVDGTLQRSSSTGSVASYSAAQDSDAPAPKAKGEGQVESATPEFASSRPALYSVAWQSMLLASEFRVDEGGDVACAFVEGLAAVYKAGMEPGAEFYRGVDGAAQRTHELLQVLDGLMESRSPPQDAAPGVGSGGPSDAVARRRPVYRPKVSPGQRAILDFLQEDLCSGWQRALQLLAKYSVADPRGAGGSTSGVTKECAGEAASTLSAMMSSKVPGSDRALALEGLLREVSAPCVRRLEAIRSSRSRDETSAEAGELEDGDEDYSATPSSDAVEGESAPPTPLLFTTSPGSYVEVMQLVLSLLRDGFPGLSEVSAEEACGDTLAPDGPGNDVAVRAIGEGVKTIGALAVSFALDSVLGEQGVAAQGSERSESGAADGNGSEEFPGLLHEALSLVTTGVCSHVTPCLPGETPGAADVVRALIDTLGALSLPHVASTLWGGNETPGSDESPQTFRLAVMELCGICMGSKTDHGDWRAVGVELRRRACWHMLRCVWSTANYLRHMEDAVDHPQPLGGSNGWASDHGAAETSESTLAQGAERCMFILEALGDLKLPHGLLTPAFRQLVAEKQARENAVALDVDEAETSAPDAAEATGADQEKQNGDGPAAVLVLSAQDIKLASLAEGGGDSKSQGPDLEGVSEKGGGDGESTREHLMVVCRALLLCTASKSFAVRNTAAALLVEANIPQAMDALQGKAALLERELQERDAQLKQAEAELRHKEREVVDLRALIAASGFM